METTRLLTYTASASANKHMQVSQNSPLSAMKWAAVRLMLSTVGRLSKGIRIGYTYGFDSGTLLDYVYLNAASGTLGLGKLIDRFYLDAVGWRAIRARRVLLKQVLRAEIVHNHACSLNTRLLDVAAGPGRYLQELLASCDAECGDVRILCRDLSQAGIEQGARQATAAGLQNIQYERGDAFQPAPVDEQLGGVPNIIVVSGLYELILDNKLIQDSLMRLYAMLVPGGVLCFTTQTHHPQLDFIANVLPNRDGVPWVMQCRSVTQVEEWAHAAGFQDVHSYLEEVGLFSITVARKPSR